MSSGISRDDWLKAMGEIGVPEDAQDAVTVPEFAEMFQLERITAERRLKALEAAGKAKRTTKFAPTTDGRKRWFVAYRLLT